VLNAVGQTFASKISRGITFYFSWLDASKEKEFADIFGQTEFPQVVVLNPGKKKRFLVHEGVIDANGVSTTLDKILGGDAKFKAIKGNKVPDL